MSAGLPGEFQVTGPWSLESSRSLVTVKHSKGSVWQDKGHLEEGTTPLVLYKVARFQAQIGNAELCDQVACATYVDFLSDRAYLNSFLLGNSHGGHHGDNSSFA